MSKKLSPMLMTRVDTNVIPIDPDFDKMKKAQLIKYAENMGVELDKNAKVEEIRKELKRLNEELGEEGGEENDEEEVS